jgi:hypothetical protein
VPPSANNGAVGDDAQPGQTLAIVAEALYLVNLLLVPGIAFLVLLLLYWRYIGKAPALARCHLRQVVAASLWAGGLLVFANAVIILIGGYYSPYTWLVVVIYFTTCHTTLVLFGTMGLAKAMSGQIYRYPLIGRPCHD